MHLLIIGGTRFVGRHIAEQAVARGHRVTLFHRGQSGKGDLQADEVLGNRDGEMGKLAGSSYDAVIDSSGYVPRVVGQSVDALRDKVGLYCFISTISVYAESAKGGQLAETAEVARFAEEPQSEEITNESYGPFKVQCEEVVQRGLPDSSLIIRPGLVVGPGDTTDRFTYWIDRFSRKGPVLIPDRAPQPIQFVDGRDLGEFAVKSVEARLAGVFNVTGPAGPLTMGEVWDACAERCGGAPERVVVSDEFLAQNEVRDWVDLPFILPPGENMLLADVSRAVAQGFVQRPLADTVAGTAAWHRARGPVELKAGMSREREFELLEKWRGQS